MPTPQLILSMTAGAFFAISGYHKLFNPERHKSLVQTLTADGVPCVKVNQWWVPFVEFSAGSSLFFGVFPQISALFLLAICTVATCVDGWKRIRDWHPLDWADAFDDVLYLPEVLYAIMLVCILIG